jgi:hypothetical protein
MKKTPIIIILTILTLSITATIVKAPPTSGLIGNWQFDEGIGSTAADATSNANDGTLSGGRFGNGLEFDGSTGYVNIPDAASGGLDGLPELTLEAWIKPDSIGGLQSQSIIGKYDTISDFVSYYIALDGDEVLLFVGESWTAYEYYTTTDANLEAGKWYHIAGTWKYDSGTSSSIFKIYVNNVEKTVVKSGGVGTVTSMQDSGVPDTISSLLTVSYGRGHYFDGVIDEVRVSDTARTSFDIVNPPSVETDTVALWHFDESKGTTIGDETTNFDGTMIGGVTWAGPVWVDGYSGKALSYDGVNDYVWINDDPLLDFGASDSFILEAWIRTTDSTSGYNNIIRKDNYQLGEPRALYLIAVYNPGGKIRGFIYDQSGSYIFIESQTVVTDGEWHHVVFVRDAVNDELRLYVDGNDDAVPVTDTTTDTLENSGWLAFGAYANTKKQGEFFEGIIDEVKVWNSIPTNLEFIQPSDTMVQMNNPATLTVKVSDALGNPVEGADVTIFSSPSGFVFSGGQFTDSNGLVTWTATPPVDVVGVFTITATTPTPSGLISDTWTLVVYDGKGMAAGGGWYLPMDMQDIPM